MSSTRQAEHYDRIISSYDEHYYDADSLAYRREFILEPLLSGLDLRGQRVADLACGSGQTSLFLMERFPGVKPEGFDISAEACRRYGEATGRPGLEFDLTRGPTPAEPFDAAIIVGGLHHCVANLPGALATVAQMLKPGGSFLMFEPNADYVLQFARRIWYRADSYFDADTEAALSHQALLTAAGHDFTCQSVRYFGGPAFFLIYNSLVLRLPHRLKHALAPALMTIERGYNRIPGRWAHASFTARWLRAG